MNLNLTTATRYGLNILALLGVAVALYLGRSIFIPLTISLMLAAILYPAARYLHHRFLMPWFLACLSIILSMVAAMLVIFFSFAASVPRLLEDLPRPNDPASQHAFYARVAGQIKKAIPFDTSDVLPDDPERSAVFQYIRRGLEGDHIPNTLVNLSVSGSYLLFQGVLILFILLFLLLEGDMLANKIRAIFGVEGDTQTRVTGALGQMAEAVRKYLVWRTIVNIGLGLVLGVVYHSIGLRQATLWALLTAIFSYVPYIGTIAAGIPPVLDCLISVGAGPALGVMIFYIGVVTFEGYIIVPWVMGRSMDLNATTVLMACLFWDLVWGTAGLFLAMPLMAAVKAVCLQVEGWKPWGELMSSEPGLPAEYYTDEKYRTQMDQLLKADPGGVIASNGHLEGSGHDDKKSHAPY